MNNDRIDNQLVHKITEEIDEGPILMSDAEIIPYEFGLPAQLKNLVQIDFIHFIKNLF